MHCCIEYCHVVRVMTVTLCSRLRSCPMLNVWPTYMRRQCRYFYITSTCILVARCALVYPHLSCALAWSNNTFGNLFLFFCKDILGVALSHLIISDPSRCRFSQIWSLQFCQVQREAEFVMIWKHYFISMRRTCSRNRSLCSLVNHF